MLFQEHLGASNPDDGGRSGDSRESFPERTVSEMQDEEAFARGEEERVMQWKEVRASRGGSKAGVMRNQPRQRSRQEAAEGSVCPTEESGCYLEDAGEPLEDKQPVTNSYYFCLFAGGLGEAWLP